MDRGPWQAAVYGVARVGHVGHDLATDMIYIHIYIYIYMVVV